MNHSEHSWQDCPDLNRVDHPTKGQRYTWEGLTFSVTRVSEAGRWADIRIEGPGGWVKRQPLPLPAGSVLVGAA